MAKLSLTNIVSGFGSAAATNANNDAIEAALENTLSRDGTSPNHMLATLDMNGNRIINLANPVTVEGFNWEGPWVTATAYVVGDVVEDNFSSYICVVDHTAGVFATDLAANKWQVVASSAALPDQSGHSGDLISTDGSNAQWVEVSSLALPIGGGTLTGPVTGTALTLSGTLIGTAATFSGAASAGSLSASGTVTGGAASFTTGAFSDLITPSQTKGIKGTTTNNTADAGSIGEYISSSVSSAGAVSMVNDISKNVTSISLSAGDWWVGGAVMFVYGTTTSLTMLQGSCSVVANTLDSDVKWAHPMAAFVPGVKTPYGFPTPITRVSITSTTTVYLVAYGLFTVSTLSAFGHIWARRAR